MALTAAQQTDAYRFFSIAFNAAPGVEYMNQIADAYATGATTKQVVNAFVSKSQFTNVYPTFLTNEAFASNLVENVVGSSAAAAAKTQAKADIVTALNGGLTRGDVIYTIFNNLAAKPAADADWGATAKMMANKVAVAQYYTEVLLGNTTNLATLQSVLSNVTPATDVSTPAAIQAVLGDVFNAQGQTFTLTANADQVPGMNGSAGTISTTGNDVYVATDGTLSSADRIVDAAGNADKLKYSSQVAASEAAFEMKGVETLEVTADAAQPVTFDLSGSEGLTLLKTLNSTGNTTYNQVTSEADIEVNNVTSGANVTVSYQDSVVAGTANDVTLTLANNSNVTPVGTITVGRTSAANAGVETISAVVSGAAATVTTLDSNISTLNVAGDKNLTITTALNTTVDTVAAGGFTGALNINLTGNVAAAGEGDLSITTGTGNDVIDLLADGDAGRDTTTVTRNATISTGAGNDTVEAGLGDDKINLGEGNDLLLFTTGGITVNDTINGGAGVDTIRIINVDTISKSEAEKVSAVEVVDLRNAPAATIGSVFVVTDNLLTTVEGDSFTIDTQNATIGHTVDLTNVTFSNTNRFVLRAEANVTDALNSNVGTNDVVIADDATVNAKAVLGFGAGAGDTLRVVDGATITSDDLAQISGLEVINLESTSNTPQIWNISLSDAFIRQASANNADATDGTAAVLATAAVGAGNLRITMDDEIPAGSTLNINLGDVAALTPAQLANLAGAVSVLRTANVTVNLVDAAGAPVVAAGVLAVVNVSGALKYTTNADTLATMTGTIGDDTFVADFLSEINAADSIQGNGQVAGDTLQLNFAVGNAAANLIGTQLNNTAIAGIERIVFNSNDVVAFVDDTVAANSTTTVVSFVTGSGNDVVVANGTINNNYNLGAGNNTWTSNATNTNNAVVTTGSGTNTINFVAVAAGGTTLTGADSVTTGTTGNGDTVNITTGAGGAGAAYLLPNVLTGVDFVTFTTANDDGLVVDNVDVNVADDGETNFTVTDGNAALNTRAIFDATALTATPTHLNTANVAVNGAAPGALGQASNAADVLGGADNDTITLGVNLGGLGGGYVVRGNAGADTIAIGANPTGVIVNFNTANDGGAQGQNTGFDVVTGFSTGADVIAFSDNVIESVFQTTVARGAVAANAKAGNAALAGVPGGAGTLVASTDAAVNFTNAQDALVITQIGGGVTDAQLTDLTLISQKANVLGVTAAATDGGIIVVQGATQSMVYLYVEQDGTANNVAANELKLLGQFDGAVVATDLWVI